MKDRYCPLPWVAAHSWTGDVTPCCLWEDSGVIAESAEDALHSDLFESIRSDMLNNKELKGCTQCYQFEAAGKKSRREDSIERYGRPTEVTLKQMDIGFDNVCNLKCRGCQSAASHLWYNDEIKMYGETISPTKYWSYLASSDVDKLERIHVAGGEPLLSKNFNTFANELLNSKNKTILELSYDTNGTVLPKENILELVKNVGVLRVGVSIDGLYGLQDYFRSGSEFNDVIEKLNFYKSLKNDRTGQTILNIQITVNIYNVNTLPDMYDYFEKHHPEFTINHRVLYWPEQLSIKNLPQDYKQKLLPLFTDSKFSDVLIELESEGKNLFDHFLTFHNRLDQIRNEDLKDSNPMLSEYIRNYNKKEVDSQVFFRQQLNYLRDM